MEYRQNQKRRSSFVSEKLNEKLEDTGGIQNVQIEWNNIENVIVEASKESLCEKKGKRNEERFDEECRTAIHEKNKNNMRKIMLQRMTKSSKETYREHRRRADKICRGKEKRDVKETKRKYRSGPGKS
jgi:hypothetical protein